MHRLIAITGLIAATCVLAGVAAAQTTAPPLCPQGSWPIRSKGSWTCSNTQTKGDDASTGTGRRGRGGSAASSGSMSR